MSCAFKAATEGPVDLLDAVELFLLTYSVVVVTRGEAKAHLSVEALVSEDDGAVDVSGGDVYICTETIAPFLHPSVRIAERVSTTSRAVELPSAFSWPLASDM